MASDNPLTAPPPGVVGGGELSGIAGCTFPLTDDVGGGGVAGDDSDMIGVPGWTGVEGEDAPPPPTADAESGAGSEASLLGSVEEPDRDKGRCGECGCCCGVEPANIRPNPLPLPGAGLPLPLPLPLPLLACNGLGEDGPLPVAVG